MERDKQIYTPVSIDEPLHQGEIVSDLIEARLDANTLNNERPSIVPQIHPYAIIITQECDLLFDYEARQTGENEHKILSTVLLCMVETAQNLRGRGHQAGINNAAWNFIRTNRHQRYHFLEEIPAAQDAIGEGLPELGVDFKKFFAVPPDELYARVRHGLGNRRCRLLSPFLEHLSTRFAYYQFRVALPEPHRSI